MDYGLECEKMKGLTTASEMAQSQGIEPKRFRQALRAASLAWHPHKGSWTVRVDSPEHKDMVRILAALIGQTSKLDGEKRARESVSAQLARATSDEAWIIDLCDQLLGEKALRQHRFPFLLGDPGPSGHRARLPVDAYYPDHRLVIEYHERQHSRPVAFFDKRQTISGVGRGEQRRIYDDLRRTVLPAQGYELVVLSYTDFSCTTAGRIIRDERAGNVVASRLRSHLNQNP